MQLVLRFSENARDLRCDDHILGLVGCDLLAESINFFVKLRDSLVQSLCELLMSSQTAHHLLNLSLFCKQVLDIRFQRERDHGHRTDVGAALLGHVVEQLESGLLFGLFGRAVLGRHISRLKNYLHVRHHQMDEFDDEVFRGVDKFTLGIALENLFSVTVLELEAQFVL